MLPKQLLPYLCTAILLFYPAMAPKAASIEVLRVKAETALSNNQLEKAQQYIRLVLQTQPDEPDHLFVAGRIAGEQAQQANIFSKLGYARAAKQYFERALSIAPEHKNSIIGLIRFHQQAPVMAGGEKESIPALVEQLRGVDQKAAFSFEASRLLDQGQLQQLDERFNAALLEDPQKDNGRFKFEHAMRLSSYQYYSQALEIMMSIDITAQESEEWVAMRWYQLAKLAAESHRELNLGIRSIERYAALPETQRTIADDWIQFRATQLRYLNEHPATRVREFQRIKEATADDSLKRKINQFLATLET